LIVLAETGDPRRYDSSSSLVKHAGLAPGDNVSGALASAACAVRQWTTVLELVLSLEPSALGALAHF
jgi:Transposase IS116/IS110/IS902 family